MSQITIKLEDFLLPEETSLVGRENGESVLKKLKDKNLDFERLEKDYEKIIIDIPTNIVSINKSFFLGLFEIPVQRLGRDGYFAKYQFNTTEHIQNKIKNHVDAALLKASQGDILNA
ncbi:MAG: hypothetical protein PHP17_00390 [Candidatus Omnitrophica bacterium]|nr:hypothetical protein [Candidatus Omnitrophota bacterium]